MDADQRSQPKLDFHCGFGGWEQAGSCGTDGADYTSPIYTSTDSGVTWTATTSPSNSWSSIASSADGTFLIAGGGFVYTSTNSGATWQSSIGGDHVTTSADGSHLVSAFYGGPICVSTNTGKNWAQTSAPFKNWNSVASSADGSKLVAGAVNNGLYTSTNFGTTWTSNAVPSNLWWASVASSADGTVMVAVAGSFNGPPGPIYVSTNSGTAWIAANAPVKGWMAVAASADGSKMFALAAGSGYSSIFYTSTNFGQTWTVATAPNALCAAIASSADGNKLVAAALPGTNIYTLRSTRTPALNLTSSSTNLTLAWTVPSTNFVLQQSADLVLWTDVTDPPALNLTNLQDEVILSPTNGSGFYRLKTP